MWAKCISTGVFLCENCFCFIIDKLAYPSHKAQKVLGFPGLPRTKTRNTKLTVDPLRKVTGSKPTNEPHQRELMLFGVGWKSGLTLGRSLCAVADQRMLCHPKWVVLAWLGGSPLDVVISGGELLCIKLSYCELKGLQVRVCSNFLLTPSSWAQPCSCPWWGIITIMILVMIWEQQGPFPDHQVLSSALIALKQHVF